MLIEIAGPRGVGKSTIINLLRKKVTFKLFEGFIKVKNESTTEEEFIENQKKYFKLVIDKINELKKDSDVSIITRGAEEMIIYTISYVMTYHPTWSVEGLEDEFKNLSKYFADKVFYITCSINELKIRWNNDTKKRTRFELWNTYNKVALNFYKKYCNNCVFINNEEQNTEDIVSLIELYIKEGK